MRDVTKDYSPALASILVDENIEVEEDFTAVILYLCSKGYLTMEKAKKIFSWFYTYIREEYGLCGDFRWTYGLWCGIKGN